MSEQDRTAPVEHRTIVGLPSYCVGDDGSISELVEYRTIAGLSFYRFGSNGTVWSCNPGRIGKNNSTGAKWHRIYGSLAKTDGRLETTLIRDDGTKYHTTISRLILEAFRGPRPDGLEACHGDGNNTNDRLSNLRWDTHKANIGDAVRHGTYKKPPRYQGITHPMAKLTEADVLKIREQLMRGARQVDIAKQYHISQAQVSDIKLRKIWKHLE